MYITDFATQFHVKDINELKERLKQEERSIERFLSKVLNSYNTSLPKNIEINILEEAGRPVKIKGEVPISDIFDKIDGILKEYYNNQSKNTDDYKLHRIINILDNIQNILYEYCRCEEGEEDNKRVLPPEIEAQLEERLKELQDEVAQKRRKRKKDDEATLLDEIKSIIQALGNREIYIVPFGTYNHNNNTITLYLETICKYANKKSESAESVLFATFAHELFHAYHFKQMKNKSIRRRTSENYYKQIVAESFASYFEYVYMLLELNEQTMAKALYESWNKYNISYWPYSYAKYLYRQPASFPAELFVIAFEDCLSSWISAYNDLCVFGRLKHNHLL